MENGWLYRVSAVRTATGALAGGQWAWNASAVAPDGRTHAIELRTSRRR